MMRAIAAALALTIVISLAGCFGGTAPVEEFLRVGNTSRGECVSGGGTVLALKDFTSLPALDRSAVLFAKERVVAPNTVWYWEGTPAELVAQAVAQGVGCYESCAVIYPYRPRIERNGQLHGRVESFEVHVAGERRFRVAFSLELWDRQGRALLARNVFTATKVISRSGANATAAAAAAALDTAVVEAAAWVDGKVHLLYAEQE